MEQVRFIIRMDRNGLKRDEAELALAPAEDWLKQQGISILMLFKGLFGLCATTDQATFEKLFGVSLTSHTQHVPNLNRAGTDVTNWKASGPLQVPAELRALGITNVDIDQQIALTD